MASLAKRLGRKIVNTSVELLPKQRVFMENQSQMLMYSGAFGAGKTLAGCFKVRFLAVFYPGNRILITRKFNKDLNNTTLWTLLKGSSTMPPVIPPEMVLDHHKTDQVITVRSSDPANPSYIFYCGLDDPDKLGSFTELGAIFIDEGAQTEEEDWVQLSGRLRHSVPFTQIFTATNPGTPSHYLYRKFFDQAGNPIQNQDIYCIETNSFENTNLPQSYIKILSAFEGVYYERYVLGKWVDAGNLIYDIFSKKVHVYPNVTLPFEWERWRSLDFGFVHPTVCQWWASVPMDFKYVVNSIPYLLPKGAIIRYKELYHTGILAEDSATMVKYASEGELINYSVGDWDAEAREIYARHGIIIKPANKSDVLRGIEETYNLMRINPDLGHTSPMIIFFDDCLIHKPDLRAKIEGWPTCTPDEIPLYKRKGVGVDAEMPLKKFDDGCDSARYSVMSRVAKGRRGPIMIKATMVT